jgi:hypothetical protein
MNNVEDILIRRYGSGERDVVIDAQYKSIKIYGEIEDYLWWQMRHEILNYFPDYSRWSILLMRREGTGWCVERCVNLDNELNRKQLGYW